jgi:glycosyltransferase involved in cell wall biosynthesis
MKPRVVLLPSNRQQRPDGSRPRFGIADAFERLGFAAEVLDVNEQPRNPLAGRASLFASIDPWRALTVLFRRRKARAIISYYQSGALAILALRRLLGFKPPVVIVDIGDDSNWPMRARIVSYCVRRADAVFCFSRDQVAGLVERHPGAKCRFLPQQIDTAFFMPGSGEGDYILAVGDDLSRDYQTFVQAVEGVSEPVIVRSSKVTPRAGTTIAPRGSEEALRALYQGAKIVVIALHDMRHPGGISTLLEAYACGKPVVVSNARGVRDYLAHEQHCLVVPCGDADGLKAAVRRLLADADLRKRLGTAARRYAETELSQELYAKRLIDAIAALAEDSEAKIAPVAGGHSRIGR